MKEEHGEPSYPGKKGRRQWMFEQFVSVLLEKDPLGNYSATRLSELEALEIADIPEELLTDPDLATQLVGLGMLNLLARIASRRGPASFIPDSGICELVPERTDEALAGTLAGVYRITGKSLGGLQIGRVPLMAIAAATARSPSVAMTVLRAALPLQAGTSYEETGMSSPASVLEAAQRLVELPGFAQGEPFWTQMLRLLSGVIMVSPECLSQGVHTEVLTLCGPPTSRMMAGLASLVREGRKAGVFVALPSCAEGWPLCDWVLNGPDEMRGPAAELLGECAEQAPIRTVRKWAQALCKADWAGRRPQAGTLFCLGRVIIRAHALRAFAEVCRLDSEEVETLVSWASE